MSWRAGEEKEEKSLRYDAGGRASLEDREWGAGGAPADKDCGEQESRQARSGAESHPEGASRRSKKRTGERGARKGFCSNRLARTGS